MPESSPATVRRLVACFAAVFPDVPAPALVEADATRTPGWDSVAGVTLLALVEEEFDVTAEADDIAGLTSFAAILAFVERARVATSAEP